MLFAVRSWRQKKATGRSGFNGFNGFRRISGRAARLTGIGFLVAILLGLTHRCSPPRVSSTSSVRLTILRCGCRLDGRSGGSCWVRRRPERDGRFMADRVAAVGRGGSRFSSKIAFGYLIGVQAAW